jgi:hypothetical protein
LHSSAASIVGGSPPSGKREDSIQIWISLSEKKEVVHGEALRDERDVEGRNCFEERGWSRDFCQSSVKLFPQIATTNGVPMHLLLLTPGAAYSTRKAAELPTWPFDVFLP